MSRFLFRKIDLELETIAHFLHNFLIDVVLMKHFISVTKFHCATIFDLSRSLPFPSFSSYLLATQPAKSCEQFRQ